MDYWDYKALGYDFYRPDPDEPGSWRDFYWWRVIIRMYNEWEAQKYDKDGEGNEGSGPPTETQPDGAVRRKPGAPRKMPQLPSQRKKG